MARTKDPKRRKPTWFESQRQEIVDGLTAAGARFVVLHPRMTAGSLEIEIDARPENLALVERAMVARDERWIGLATQLAATPGAAISTGLLGSFISRSMTPAIAPSGDGSALLAAVLADPDSDVPRRIYADWLLERGDPRGELIAMQCERNADAAQRAHELLAIHWKTFAGELHPYCDASSFERGFLTRARMTFAAFAKHGDALVTREPVERVTIVNEKWSAEHLARLADAPALERLRQLWITCHPRRTAQGNWIGGPMPDAHPVGPLARSSHLRSLRDLLIGDAGVSNADWAKFARDLDAPQLERLRLDYNRSNVALYENLTANPRLPRLRAFEESSTSWIGAVNARTIAAIGNLAQIATLQRLVLHNDRLADAAVLPFFGSSPAILRTLELDHCPVTDTLARVIARSPKASALEELRITSARLTMGGIRELLVALPNLRSVGFGVFRGTEATAFEDALLALPTSHALRTVQHFQPSDALRERYEIS